MTREQAYAAAAASSQPTTWVIRQPSGNYYVANRARQPDGVAVAVRRGRGAVQPILPRAWTDATRCAEWGSPRAWR